jgi:hypothetical protein
MRSWWAEGMLSALTTMLTFFDAEPALARVCMVEVATAEALVRASRGHLGSVARADPWSG